MLCLLRGTFYILHSAHTVRFCVLFGSENKQRLPPLYTIDWLALVMVKHCVLSEGESKTFALCTDVQTQTLSSLLILHHISVPHPSQSHSTLYHHHCTVTVSLHTVPSPLYRHNLTPHCTVTNLHIFLFLCHSFTSVAGWWLSGCYGWFLSQWQISRGVCSSILEEHIASIFRVLKPQKMTVIFRMPALKSWQYVFSV